MPDIKIAVVRAASSAATGTQDFTSSGFGTPKAAMFIISKATVDGTAKPDAYLGMGATDGTRQWTIANASRDNQANTSVGNRQMTDMCVSLVSNAGTVDGEAAFSSWITDGIRINWNVATSGAYLITCILFGGADMAVRADSVSLGTSTSAQTYSSMGFEADVLIMAGSGQSSIDAGQSNFQFWMGFVHNNGAGTITQMSQGLVERNNQADGIPHSRMMTDKFGFLLAVTNGAVSHEYTASNFGSAGFDFTSNNNANSTYFHFLALDLGGLDANVVQHDSPTSTGSNTIASASFTPQFCLVGSNANQAVDTTEADADAGVMALHAIDASNQFSTGVSIEDAAATTNTSSYVENDAIFVLDHTQGTQQQATFSSFSSSGTNLSFSTANGTARKWIALMIETAAAGDVSADVPAGVITFTGVAATAAMSGSVPAGEVAFSGVAPTADRTADIPPGPITFTGVAPVAAIEAAVPPGPITFAGVAPTAAFAFDVPAGVITFSGVAPVVSETASVPAGSIAFAGVSPSTDRTADVPAGTIHFGIATESEIQEVYFNGGTAGALWMEIPSISLFLATDISQPLSTWQTLFNLYGTVASITGGLRFTFDNPSYANRNIDQLNIVADLTNGSGVTITTIRNGGDGYAVTAQISTFVPAAVITFTGPEATAGSSAAVPPGSISFAGAAPTETFAAAVPAGEITFTGVEVTAVVEFTDIATITGCVSIYATVAGCVEIDPTIAGRVNTYPTIKGSVEIEP